MKRALAAVAASIALAGGLGSAGARERLDYAGTALNILPPGQSGDTRLPRNATDQLALYDALTPREGNVTAADLTRYFKSARFGAQGRTTVERPRRGLRIARDRFGVPHIYGRTRADVMFGTGWVTAADRGLLMNLFRGPGRIAALDVPGVDPFQLVLSPRPYVPSAAVEAELARQVGLLRRLGAEGRRIIRDVDAYLAGINGYNRAKQIPIRPWTRNDVIASVALLGARFGAGGGDEVRRSMFLDALRDRLGPALGRQVFDELRRRDDPEAPVSVAARFPYAQGSGDAGTAVVDDGSFVPWRGAAVTSSARASMSNMLLVSGRRSANGHPLFVAGPQLGMFFPQLFLELDLHGGGIDARGGSPPGLSFYVIIGRARDYAWSLTSAGSDVVDQVVETLCGGDDLHYVFRGECRAMEVVDAGTLGGAPLTFRRTVHGPVLGYATVNGTRVAISHARSTRGREVLSARFFKALNENRVRSAQDFVRASASLELTFNAGYADDRDIAMVSTGRFPLRRADSDPGLPRLGNGENEWRGFARPAAHPRVINPSGGVIVNWNNKPSWAFGAADDNWVFGSVQRVELLTRGLAARRTHTLASVVSAMNRAASQDLRAVEVWPVVRHVLGACDAAELSCRAAGMVDEWVRSGASRLDREPDGRVDAPAAAILDAAWPKLADAVMRPVLGDLTGRLTQLVPRDDPPAPTANAYGGGWYGYVESDLRAVLGDVIGTQRTRLCGAGDLARCRGSLWVALEDAVAELAAAEGREPAAWRAGAERIRFAPGFLPATARFTNRPTFQQVITFTGHRPR